MKRIALLFLLCAAPLFASDANLAWVQPAGGATPSSWSVYVGIASGAHSVTASGLLATNYSFPDGSMMPNVRNYVVVTATGLTGESAKSVEINGFPRPVITSAVPVDMTSFVRLTVGGFNFSDGLSNVDINFPGMTIISVTRLTANLLEIDYTIDPGTPPVAADLTVASKWQRGPAGGDAGLVVSAISAVFPVPTLMPLPPVIMDVN